MDKVRKKIAIAFRGVGPYHAARISAFSKLDEFEVVALELSGKKASYLELNASDSLKVISVFLEDDIRKIKVQRIREEIYKILDAGNPEVVVIPGWGTMYSLVMLKWCNDNSIPAILMSDSTEGAQKRFGVKEFFKKNIVQMFSAALVAGKVHAEYVKKLGMPKNRTFLGFDVVDNSYFQKGAALVAEDSGSARSQFNLPEKYFLVVSRFVHVKNIARILKAFALYKKEAKSDAWDLLLVGAGPEEPALRDICGLLPELSEGVHFVGSRQYKELPSFYALAKCLILASTSETWGLVVNEAMASGLPILLSSECGCANDLLKDGENGFIFDPYDENNLAKAMIRISSPALDLAPMSVKSRELIAEWDLDRFTKGLNDAVVTALTEKPIKTNFIGSLLLNIFTKL